ncbi:MAG: adenylate/guanylate cyclase domain-containing protein [Actinobacteria bacterium]|nr:adenylate/guanylate cyclase domain-containing protein [Actinomycetota bacterium]
MTGSLPENPRLREIAIELEKTRGAAALHDRDRNLVWVSSELKALIGEYDEDKLGYGRHALEAYLSPTWGDRVTDDTKMHLFQHLPYMIATTPGGKERIKQIFLHALRTYPDCLPEDLDPATLSEEAISEFIDGFEPVEPSPVFTLTMEFLDRDLPPMPITEVCIQLNDHDGTPIGIAMLYDPGLPARVLAMLARGDETMYTRMANLADPGKHRAAILFADLQGSAGLSRRLPSAIYFQLVRAMTTATDEVIIKHHGIVGKHAGDGATAFFLADELGSASAAARAAIEAARAIGSAVGTAAKEIADETGLIEASECLVNVGLHWGATLYMGQLVTGGRLEVTALGDEVNECARIQTAARDGQVLASKSLLEHLERDDAAELRVNPDLMLYRTLSEIPGAPEKSVKDAGGIPVTTL